MPHVNGQFYHSAGQGYAAEKNKMAASHSASENQSGTEKGKGSIVHVKHHGGGKFSVKHDGGKVESNLDKQGMLDHLQQAFPDAEQHQEGENEEGMGGAEPNLSSILA